MTDFEFWWLLPFTIVFGFIIIYLVMYLLFSKPWNSHWKGQLTFPDYMAEYSVFFLVSIMVVFAWFVFAWWLGR